MVETPKPRIFYGWWIVCICFLGALFGNSIINYGFTAFIESFAGEFGWSYAQISVAASIRGLETGIAAPLLGWIIERWGAKKTVFFGSIITCIGLLLLSQTKTLGIFYVAYILIGIGVGGCSLPVWMIIIARWFRKRIGLAIGIATSGYGFSGLFIPLLTYIIEQYTWRSAILAILVSIIVVILPLSFFLRDKPEQYGLLPDGESTLEIKQRTAGERDSSEADLNLKQAIRNSVFWKFTIAFTCFLFVQQAVITHVMPYLGSIGIDKYISSAVASALSLVSIAGRIGLGWIGDRFNKSMVTAGAYLMIGLAMICFGCAPTSGSWLIIPFIILFSIGYGGAMSMSGSLGRVLFGGSNFGVIYGCIMGITLVGTLIGPPLAGLVFDNWGTYQGFWLISAGISIAAMIIIQTVPAKLIQKQASLAARE